MPSPNNMEPEKITKAKAKQIKVKLAKHFKDAKYAPMLMRVETCTDQSETTALVLDELEITQKLELG